MIVISPVSFNKFIIDAQIRVVRTFSGSVGFDIVMPFQRNLLRSPKDLRIGKGTEGRAWVNFESKSRTI